jgi:hypothetical protein
MSDQPDFVIVCDHGIRGGQLDHVARYRPVLFAPRGAAAPEIIDSDHWWPTQDDDVVRLTPLEGDRRGWPLPRQMPGYQDKPDDEPMRRHHEIPCPADDCTLWAYRGDDDELQPLFRLIVSDQRYHNLCVSVTDTEITMTLGALRSARDTADRLGLLK